MHPSPPRPLRTRLLAAARAWAWSWAGRFSFVGLIVAAVFFSASVTPSLLPRSAATQGLLSGFAAAAGYGLGVLGAWLYGWLGFRPLSGRAGVAFHRTAVAAAALVFAASQWRMTFWQNDLRALVGMDPLESAAPWTNALIAAATAAALVTLGRGIGLAVGFTSRRLQRVVPRRVAGALAAVVVGLLVLFLANGVIGRGLHAAADAVFVELNARQDPDFPAPTASPAPGVAPLGGPGSHVDWQTLGRLGRAFVAGGPTAGEIASVTGRPAVPPLRVYAGLRPDQTAEERAALALAELRRLGGFGRRVLVVATPTGTGWLDPGGVDSVEILHGGDTAIVATQYSYLPSWMTLLVAPEEPVDSARALFDAVYGHWTTLPADGRPELYLHGLSLGALGGGASVDLPTIFEDPIDGALWVGTPFPAARWRELTARRNPGSPAWLPEVRDGRLVRFATPQRPVDPDRPWGPVRTVYLQHASDPMVFFSPDLFWHRPDWLGDAGEARGPDVSGFLRWFPVVTGLQLAFDLPRATAVPFGHGHNYAAVDYLDGWIAVTQPEDWTAADTERVKRRFEAAERE